MCKLKQEIDNCVRLLNHFRIQLYLTLFLETNPNLRIIRRVTKKRGKIQIKLQKLLVGFSAFYRIKYFKNALNDTDISDGL